MWSLYTKFENRDNAPIGKRLPACFVVRSKNKYVALLDCVDLTPGNYYK